MLKKTVNFTDYDGNPASKVCYFHLNKFEWLELEAYTKGGLIENLEHSLETNNAKKTIDLLKRLFYVPMVRKNPETGVFEKDDDLAVRFSKTEAFSELFLRVGL